MSYIEPECRETVINLSDGFKRCNVYSEQKSVISKVKAVHKKHPEAVLIIREGKHGKTPYIEADMPATFIGLRPAKFGADADNDHPSPLHPGMAVVREKEKAEARYN